MKHQKLLTFSLALLPVLFTACSDDDDEDLIGHWVRMSDFDGLARAESAYFTIGNKGYLACGYDGSSSDARMSDLWEYDMTTGSWTQKASFPGTARYCAAAFSNGSRGFVTTGRSSNTRFDDIWELLPYEYDPDDE